MFHDKCSSEMYRLTYDFSLGKKLKIDEIVQTNSASWESELFLCEDLFLSLSFHVSQSADSKE